MMTSTAELQTLNTNSSSGSLISEDSVTNVRIERSNSGFPRSRKSTVDESKLSIGQRHKKPFSRSSIKIDVSSTDESDVFSISSFDSDLMEGSRMKVLYDVEEDIVTVKKVLAEGWLFKKGSGHDFICSTRWKSRWAELAIVKMPQYEMDVPALLMYWHPSSVIPTSFIPLYGADVVSIDEDSESNRHRFKILTIDSYNDEDARIFSTEPNLRDEWVHVINIAIRDYHARLEEGSKSNEIRMQKSEDPTELWMEASQCCSNVKVRYMTSTD